MPTLTVFTPTYNRGHTLPRTYQSLCRQTCKDFEWLVIDDGSSDETGELVKFWMKKAQFKIRYIRQENQGMHGAHNTAYRNIDTELNVCIDSDDWMPDDAVEKIVKTWENCCSEKLAGIIGLDVRKDGSLVGKKLPSDIQTTTLSGYYENGGAGDKKLVYRTGIINEYPEYPLFPGERYLGLAYKYMLIDQNYELQILNEPLVIVEYQSDGSSNSIYRQYWNNPRGFSFFRKTEMVTSKRLVRRFMSCIHYVNSSIRSRNWKFLSESPKKFMTVLAIPFGAVLYFHIRSKVRSHARYVIK